MPGEQVSHDSKPTARRPGVTHQVKVKGGPCTVHGFT